MSACTCEGGHPILCPVHAEEAMELMQRLSVAADSSRLTIPEEARQAIVDSWQAAAEACENAPFGGDQTIRSFIAKSAEDAAAAAAPLIVAAELERLAESEPKTWRGLDGQRLGRYDVAVRLRGRAAELRGGVS